MKDNMKVRQPNDKPVKILKLRQRNGIPVNMPELGRPLEGRSTHLRRRAVVLSAMPENPEERQQLEKIQQCMREHFSNNILFEMIMADMFENI